MAIAQIELKPTAAEIHRSDAQIKVLLSDGRLSKTRLILLCWSAEMDRISVRAMCCRHGSGSPARPREARPGNDWPQGGDPAGSGCRCRCHCGAGGVGFGSARVVPGEMVEQRREHETASSD